MSKFCQVKYKLRVSSPLSIPSCRTAMGILGSLLTKIRISERQGAWCVLHRHSNTSSVILRTRMYLPVTQNERCTITYAINITSGLVRLSTTQYLIITNIVSRNNTTYIIMSLHPGEVNSASICIYMSHSTLVRTRPIQF